MRMVAWELEMSGCNRREHDRAPYAMPPDVQEDRDVHGLCVRQQIPQQYLHTLRAVERITHELGASASNCDPNFADSSCV